MTHGQIDPALQDQLHGLVAGLPDELNVEVGTLSFEFRHGGRHEVRGRAPDCADGQSLMAVAQFMVHAFRKVVQGQQRTLRGSRTIFVAVGCAM